MMMMPPLTLIASNTRIDCCVALRCVAVYCDLVLRGVAWRGVAWRGVARRGVTTVRHGAFSKLNRSKKVSEAVRRVR